ncbi:FUSC family protein [Modestobacter sp. NPDC049651]|uniref:FUSC family protein n=1 Tax=unclassified Modestobacter TaxID=2643866 RepID=UPI0033EC7286
MSRGNDLSVQLTDDVLTQQPRARSPRAWLREAVDRLAGADPGLNQLRMGLQAVLGIALAVGLVHGFVQWTGGLQVAPGSAPPAAVAAGDHALLVVSMLLGGMVAMMASFVANDPRPRDQLVTTVLLPLPMLAAVGAGLAIGSYRVPSLAFLVVLLTLAVYVRRWGPRGFAGGMVAFNGGFLGFFLHAQLGLGDLGWLAADLYLGVLASLVVRFGLLRPDTGRTLARMRRSWEARARRLLRLSAAVLTEDDGRRRTDRQEQLRRQLVRLNESTLMIDAQLAAAVPATAEVQAQRLYDAEVSLANCARFASALAVTGAPATVRVAAQSALAALLTGDAQAVGAATTALRASGTGTSARTGLLAARLATSVDDHAGARRALTAAVTDRPDGPPAAEFVPAVELAAGWLPGSFPVSLAASTTPGRGGVLDRSAMPPYVRTAVQIAVAGTLAVVVGDLISPQRMYWAVLSTFLAFMAATNSGEQLRRALFRVTGTAAGIVLGDLLVHLTGGNTWASLLIVLVALFSGIYLIRVNYAFMVIGITVTMSQLYVQLAEFSWHLLLLRLLETAVGVGAVVVTVLLVVPLRPQRVLTAGVLLWATALRRLVEATLDRLSGAGEEPLRPLVREADAAYAGLVDTARPLRSTTFGRNSDQLAELLATSAAARAYARSLAAQADAVDAPVPDAGLAAASDRLRESLAAVQHRIETGEHGRYVRSAALVELAAEQLRPRHTALHDALRDLIMLDGALARLATALRMDVADLDTTTPSGPALGGAVPAA